MSKTCVICGKAALSGNYTVCANPDCAVERQRRWYWKSEHPGKPLTDRKPRRTHCVYCGKPLPFLGAPRKCCRGYCERRMDSDKHQRFYEKHRDRILANLKVRRQRRETA